jgi:hypothetical protein
MGTYPTSATVTIKQGCTAFPLVVQVTDLDGVPVDLSGYASATFFMISPVDGGYDEVKINASAVISSAVDGQIQYNWIGVDVDTPGDYIGSFKLLAEEEDEEGEGGGEEEETEVAVLKVPSDSSILIRIIADIEPAPEEEEDL